MKIKVIDPVFSQVVNKGDAKILLPVLSHKSSYWRRGPFANKEETKRKQLIKKGIFLTGFLPSIRTFCNHNRIELEAVWPGLLTVLNPPTDNPPGIVLDPHQKEALKAMIIHTRGVIHYPTGSGKTEIFLSYLYNNPSKALIIVNTQDLLLQTYNRAVKMFGIDVVGIIGANNLHKNIITVATYQTLKKLIYNPDWRDYFEELNTVIVDECHHVSQFSFPFTRGKGGSYSDILTCIPAPNRFGFTGTLPYIEEAQKALEGYIGPVIAAKKISESTRLAKMRLILKKLPITKLAKEAKNYPEVYKWGVIYNSRRNKQVLIDTMHMVEQGRTVLILVTAIQHGTNIIKLCSKLYPSLDIEYVWGGREGHIREQIRERFNKKEMKVVIADAVWKEGVDIPSVGCVINAAGGKSEIMTIQSIGRGLRKIDGEKEDVICIDYFDPSHRYLRDHFAERLTLYFEEGWLGGE
jgi:superfamily II DNA or RNA helicase